MPDIGIDQKDVYFVAVKIFLEKDGRILILRDNFGDWDLVGGRIKKNEFDTPLEKMVRHKLSEELGDAIQYEIGKPVVFMRHERTEAAPGNPTVRIFALGYEATLVAEAIQLSERHPEMLWVDPSTFEPEKYFTGGWLKGVKEYLLLRNDR